MSNSESFRNTIASKLFDILPQDQLKAVLSAVDTTLPDYDVSRKNVALITVDGIPEVVKYYLASKSVKNASGGTLKIYKLRLTDFFSRVRKPFQDISANDIRMYLYFYKDSRNASNAYLENIRLILNGFFSWLVTNDYLIRNPCASVEKIKFQPAERVPLTSYQLEVLRDHCKTLREKALVDLLFSTGMRISECRNLDLSDIDWENRSITVRHGKGDKRRVVFFDAEAELSLRKYFASRTDSCEAVFVTDRKPHRRLCLKAIENIVTKISKRTDLHVYPHKLRHTFATSSISRGMPLEDLQAIMGHSDPQTTLIYAKISQANLRNAYQRIYS